MFDFNKYTASDRALFEDKKDCCGCGVCSYICPKNAVKMELDSFGAYYPSINGEICVGCNLCVNSCPFKNRDNMSEIVKAYAAANRNDGQLRLSSSGGVFSAIASYFLDNGDAVCGSIMDLKSENSKIHHCVITNKDDLSLLQGSKYGQSRVYDIYELCNSLLKANKKILFSGTPCQVNAFMHLFKKYKSQIFTLDLICHGIAGNKIFDDYVRFIENNTGYKITGFVFRDKDYGWGCNGKYSTLKVEIEGEEKKMKLECKEISSSSSYYRYFMSGDIYRDCCYECPFASDKRVGDLTIGDYWGVEKFNPELLSENGYGLFEREKGISCVLVNSIKGAELIQSVGDYCEFVEVDRNNVIKGNTQLNHPVKLTDKRENLKKIYIRKGYEGIDKVFYSDLRKGKLKRIISRLIPRGIKNIIKKAIKR